MVQSRQAAIRSFDLLMGCGGGDFQHDVVVVGGRRGSHRGS